MGQMRRRGMLGRVAGVVLTVLAAVCGNDAAAVVVEEFVPQGRATRVESVQLRFSSPAAAFGNPQAVPPVQLDCNGPVPKGEGRWLDDRRWAYFFERPLPAGVACVATPDARFRALDGRPLRAHRYTFDTGAPAVVESRPFGGWEIDEEQIFVLRFDAPVDAQQVAAHSHCVVEGMAERIPVHAVSDDSMAPEQRRVLLEAAMLPEPEDPGTIAFLQCARALPADGKVRVEIGPGLRASGQPAELQGSAEPHVLMYDVRPAFTARLTCTRERAGRPCLPITPIQLNFSAPVSRSLAAQVRLRSGDREYPVDIDDDDPEFVSSLRFPGPFHAGGTLVLSLPEELRDDAGRIPENAGQFPLNVALADYPPLAKFASGTFGVIERFAYAPEGRGPSPSPAVPVTLRHIEADAAVRSAEWSAGEVANLRTVNDADVLQWYSRLQRMDSGTWTQGQYEDILAGRAPRDDYSGKAPRHDVRGLPLLKTHAETRRLKLPGAVEDGSRPLEVVGIPIEEPGFHVLEIESPRLGASLLEHGGPMYVRTGVLLTNLSVHVKRGRDDLLVWVTTLSRAEPVPGAELRVLDCNGRPLLTGRTDENGMWHHPAAVAAPDYCPESGLGGLFVSARIPADHPQAYGSADYSFVLTEWDRGIEAWRFNVPTSESPSPERLIHTVFDRTLFRAGETVSMKHYLREETRQGLGVPDSGRPDRLVIEHEGSGQHHELPVGWRETPSGGLYALSEFALPEGAPLGTYTVRLTDEEETWYGSSSFRVEEFRLPILAGQLDVAGSILPDVLVAPETLDVRMQLAWLSGGPASGQRVTLRGVAEDRYPRYDGFDDYAFQAPPRAMGDGDAPGHAALPDADGDGGEGSRLFLDGKDFVLDAHGVATLTVDAPPRLDRPQRVLLEASFADPNGEIQTLSRSVDVWPAAVQAGLKTEGWGRADSEIPVTMIALGPDARPQAGIPMQLQVVERKMYSVRKRMVGGFYRYESQIERVALGTFCEGHTGAAGILTCQIRLPREGSYELVAVAKDAAGLSSRAYTSLWLSGAEGLWFGGGDDDRIDLIPARREWRAGEEAEFQVRMPFREALALVTVEREGILWKQLARLEGKNPVVRVPVAAEWGPNAYVSVLVLRGRLYEVPWRSFLRWGWRRPAQWMEAYRDNPDDTLVTQRVDLARPAFRLGVSELRVTGTADRLHVAMTPDRAVARVKDEVSVRLQVRLSDGTPAARGSVAFAVVDEALLELSPNESWRIYEAMHPRRSLSVRTATTQLEVVGRRHYGRKAVAAGGGGGMAPTRQLFDTLIVWLPDVQLDDDGKAELRFRLNDALSRFRLVALADYGAGHFGVAETSIITRQEVQVVSGLPPTVREGDAYLAQFTVRNATTEVRDLRVTATRISAGREDRLPVQTLRLRGGETGVVSWNVSVGELPWPQDTGQVEWRVDASDGDVGDRIVIVQQIVPRVPATTVQAAFHGIREGQSVTVALQTPQNAQRNMAGEPFGGVLVDVDLSIAGSLQGVRDWWERYPYVCLEQTASKAIALEDGERWSRIVANLGAYMDDDGLLRYFPGIAQGSEVLTAYLVSVQDDARREGIDFGFPEFAFARMLDGLQAFATGQIRRDARVSAATLDARRVAVLEALARHGRVTQEMLSNFSRKPSEWATPTLVDWLSLLLHLPQSSWREREIGLARNLLMVRMSVSGGAMVFVDRPSDTVPELMTTGVTSLARLMLAVMDRPEWQGDLPLMAKGLVGMQTRGAWSMTTENLLGTLALRRFARRFESVTARGAVEAFLQEGGQDSAPAGDAKLSERATAAVSPRRHVVLPVDSGEVAATGRLPWPQGEGALHVRHSGSGTAWVGVRAMARIEPQSAQEAGFRLARRVIPVLQAVPDRWSRGDVYRVELEIHAREGSTWVALTDPIPAGSTILGSGLGRDAGSYATNRGDGWAPAHEERTSTAFHAYFDYLPAGTVRVSYTVRLNAVGNFNLPASRVEALYRPDLYGVYPNGGVNVEPGVFDGEAGMD